MPGFKICGSLQESHLITLFNTLQAEGLVEILFYDGCVKTCEEFVNFAHLDEQYLYGVYSNEDAPLGLFWINNFLGRAAMFHFCFFCAGQPLRFEIGREVLKFMFETGNISALYTITPTVYRHVFPYAESLGFEFITELPHCCIFMDGKTRNGKMMKFTPGAYV